MLAFNGVLGLSGQASAALCHCDLTSGFCDIGCCCDTDCGIVKNPSFRQFQVIAIILKVTHIVLILRSSLDSDLRI